MFRTSFYLLLCTLIHGAETPTNILIIVTDDLRPDCLTLTGAKTARLPNLEQLATRSCTFTKASLQGSTYPAVCVASRAMLLTGRGVARLPADNKQIRAADFSSTLPRTFQALGYTTFHTGKNESRPINLYTEFQQSQILPRSVETEAKHGVNAANFITTHTDKPWLAYVEFALPHDPQNAPQSFYERFKPSDMEDPIDFRPEHAFNNGELKVRDELTLPRPLTLDSVKGKRARYWASAAWMDEQLGVILSALKSSGQENRTLIIFIGDNGLSLGDHGLLGKQNLYAFGGMHIPFLVAGPGIKPQKSEALAQVHDIFPTAADAAKCPSNLTQGVDGLSLLPVAQGSKSELARKYAFSRYRKVQFSVTDGHWKLIHYPEVNITQLFNLQTDPTELRNLAEESSVKTTRTVLEGELAGWRKSL
jgi:arylsulfatase A-like enzyme